MLPQEDAFSSGEGSASDSGSESGSDGQHLSVGGLRSQTVLQSVPGGRGTKMGRLRSDEAPARSKASKPEKSGLGGSGEGKPSGRQKKMRGLFGAAIGKL